jgi:hypothetical protein
MGLKIALPLAVYAGLKKLLLCVAAGKPQYRVLCKQAVYAMVKLLLLI